jgi:hypothetical protein
MPGSPEVVQPLPSSRSRVPDSRRADRSGESVAPPEPGPRSSSGISKVAWVPQGDLEQSEWLATGRKLGAIGRCSQWWIGDWIRYGTARWGERYVDAARVTGYDVATLRNMAWVASQFDLSLRSDKLSWSHHVLLAPLAREDQCGWIEKAVEERLSVADLRLELRKRGHGSARGKVVDDEGKGRGAEVCPHCGHRLSGPTG